MNKPTTFAFLMGNNFTLACGAALSCYMLLWLAQGGTVNGLALVCCLGLTWIAWKARQRIRSFPNMSKAPMRRASVFMALLVWIGAPLWAVEQEYGSWTRPYEICCMLWVIASLALILWAASLLWTIVWMLFKARAKPSKLEHHIVMQALRIPSGSPGAPQIIAALPPHALRCLDP